MPDWRGNPTKERTSLIVETLGKGTASRDPSDEGGLAAHRGPGGKQHGDVEGVRAHKLVRISGFSMELRFATMFNSGSQ